MQAVIAGEPNLEVLEGEVKKLLVEGKRIRGIRFRPAGQSEIDIGAESVVITAGTFMRGLMHCGQQKSDGGRFGEKSSIGLSDHLKGSASPSFA